jgi:hypothetical protein
LQWSPLCRPIYRFYMCEVFIHRPPQVSRRRSERTPHQHDTMRKVVYAMSVSLDGFIEATNGDFGWLYPDDELYK